MALLDGNYLAGVSIGRVLLPAETSRRDLSNRVGLWQAGLSTGAESPGFTVCEYLLAVPSRARAHRYAYLVLYDPNVVDVRGQVLTARWDGLIGSAVQVETSVGKVLAGPVAAVPATAPAQYNLPTASVGSPTETALSLPATYTLTGATAPILILASQRLDWSVRRVFTSTGP